MFYASLDISKSSSSVNLFTSSDNVFSRSTTWQEFNNLPLQQIPPPSLIVYFGLSVLVIVIHFSFVFVNLFIRYYSHQYVNRVTPLLLIFSNSSKYSTPRYSRYVIVPPAVIIIPIVIKIFKGFCPHPTHPIPFLIIVSSLLKFIHDVVTRVWWYT